MPKVEQLQAETAALETEVAQLQTEVAQLQDESARLAQLETELTPQSVINQAALIAGDAVAVASAAGVSVRLDAVKARRAQIATQLQTLGEQAQPLRTELARVANEARLRDELRALATVSAQTLTEMESERARIDAFLSEAAPRLSEARQNLFFQRRQFLNIVAQLAPTVGAQYGRSGALVGDNTQAANGLRDELSRLNDTFDQIEADGGDLAALRFDFQLGVAARAFDRPVSLAPRRNGKALNFIEGIV